VNFGAALYAPLRFVVSENDERGSTFEYDEPSSQFGQFHDPRIDTVGKSLDEHLLQLVKKVNESMWRCGQGAPRPAASEGDMQSVASGSGWVADGESDEDGASPE
jgi:hypothetical protein